jgi:hypothetical protein
MPPAGTNNSTCVESAWMLAPTVPSESHKWVGKSKNHTDHTTIYYTDLDQDKNDKIRSKPGEESNINRKTESPFGVEKCKHKEIAQSPIATHTLNYYRSDLLLNVDCRPAV